MTVSTNVPTAMTGEEMVALSKRHTIYEWSAQGAVDPIPVARAKGIYFWTPEGKRFIDFNSQLMCVNIGHGDERVIRAIQEQAADARLRQPVHGDRGARAARRQAGGDHARRHRQLLLHQRRRRSQRERDQDRALVHRAPQDPGPLPLVPRRHRRRDHADRRSAALGRRARHPRRRPRARLLPRRAARLGHRRPKRWRGSRKSSSSKGRRRSPAFIIEPVTGTNGILVPPDGYLQGVRALCDKHGILLIADEVMAGFGRTGEWFAVDHWKVVPDIMTMAKGLTSAYVQLGAVGLRRQIADLFTDRVFSGGLTYNSHPLACAAALATIAVYEEDRLIERARTDGRADGGAAGRSRRHGIRRSAPCDRSGCSGSSSWCATARRASRWRRSTAARRRCRRSASSSARKGSTRSSAGTRSSPTRR